MNDSIKQRLLALNAGFRVSLKGPTFKLNEITDKNVQVDNGGYVAEIYDLTVNESYSREYSNVSELDAIEKALVAAEKSPKPMTKAQKADAEKNRKVIDDKDARIAELEAKISELTKSQEPKQEAQGQKPAESPAPNEASKETPSTQGQSRPHNERFRPNRG